MLADVTRACWYPDDVEGRNRRLCIIKSVRLCGIRAFLCVRSESTVRHLKKSAIIAIVCRKYGSVTIRIEENIWLCENDENDGEAA